MDFDSDDALRFSLVSGDVLVCEGGEVGRAAIWTGQLDECYYQKALHRVRTSKALNPHFLRYLLEHYALTKTFAQYTSGSTISHLPQEDLRNLTVPVPPAPEQKRIVAAIEEQLSRLDAGMVALERIRQSLRRMRASVLHQAISGQDLAKCDQVPFGNVLREPLRNGYSAKADPHGTVPVFTLTAVTLGDFSDRNIKMTAADPQRIRGLWIRPEDILIERSNTRELVGTARLYRGPSDVAIYPDLIIRARVKDSVVPEYAELVLQSPDSRRYFQRRARGISGTMPKIDQGVIERLPFPIPPRSIQDSIVSEAERRITMLDALGIALVIAEKRGLSLRSSVLAAAFSGKLVPQDPKDEPASVLLESIAAGRASSNGQKPTKARSLRRRIATA